MRPIVLSILLGATFGLAAAAVTVARDAWRDIDEAQASILFRGEDMGLERTLTADYEADDHSHFQEVALWTGEAGRRLGIRFVAFHPGRAGRLPTSLDADLIHSVWPETFEAAPTALGPVQKGVNLLGPLAYRRFWSDGDACFAGHQTFGATERKRANKLIALFYCRGDGIPPVEAEIAWILKSIGVRGEKIPPRLLPPTADDPSTAVHAPDEDRSLSEIAPAIGGDAAERLRQLDELRERGLITPSDYDASRPSILDGG